MLWVVVLVIATGCGGPAPRLAADRPAPDPLSLLGWWQVEGIDQVVLVDPAGIEVVAPCGAASGRWRADPDGRFVAGIDVGDAAGPCPDDAQPAPGAPEWLADAAGFALDGPDRLLLDRAGAETARLRPAPPSTGSGGVDPARPPTEDERRALGRAAPVPLPLRPAPHPDLVGRWAPVDHPGSDGPFVELAVDGTWTGSDGCNGTAGTWVAGPDGGFLASASGVSTLIACDGVDVGSVVFAARRAAFEGPLLVLLDVGGAPLGRFQRV